MGFFDGDVTFTAIIWTGLGIAMVLVSLFAVGALWTVWAGMGRGSSKASSAPVVYTFAPLRTVEHQAVIDTIGRLVAVDVFRFQRYKARILRFVDPIDPRQLRRGEDEAPPTPGGQERWAQENERRPRFQTQVVDHLLRL